MPLVQEIRTDDSDHQRAIKRAQAETEKLRNKVDQLTAASRKGGAAQKRNLLTTASVGKMAATQITGMIAGYASLSSAVGLVNQQIQIQIDLSRKAAEAQLRTADTQRDFLINSALVPQEKVNDAMDELRSIADRTRVPIERLFQPLAGAFSASGGDLAASLNAVEAAALAKRKDPSALASAFLDISKLTGTKDARQNAAFLTAALGQARVEDPIQFAENVVPGAANVKFTGGTSDVFAFNLVSALTQRLTDKTGQQAATAATRLASTLKEQFPDLTTQQAIEKIRITPGLPEQVAGKIRKGATKPAITELFDPESFTSKELARAQEALSGLGDRAAFADEFFRRIESTPLQQVSRFSSAIDRLAEREKLRQPDPLQTLVAQEEKILEGTGGNFPGELLSRQILGGFQSRGRAIESLLKDVSETPESLVEGGFIGQFTDEQRNFAKDVLRALEETRRAIEQQGRSGANRTLDQNVRD